MNIKFRPKISIWLLLIGVISNSLVWGLIWIYLKLDPTYTSEWAVIVLGPDPGVQLYLPDVGRATPNTQSDRPREYQDPRDDYVYIFKSPAVLDKAAELMDMSVDDFGEPEITINRESALITFEISGETPEQAQEKSKLIYKLWSEAIDKLRQRELQRRQEETEATLEKARQRLSHAQQKLANYKAQSNFSSSEQIKDLSTNVEHLRRQYAELAAEEQGINQRFQQLSRDVDSLSDQQASDVYVLQADEVYQEQFTNYAQISSEFADLSSQLGLQHPLVVEKRLELEGSLKILIDRASLLLNKPVSQKSLIRLSSLTVDPKIRTIRQDLFKEMVTVRSQKEATTAQKQELKLQIDLLENRLRDLTQKQLNIQNFDVDLQLAEAIFAETLAKLDLGKGDIYSIYPPFQLLAEPTLADPDDPSSPSFKLGILSGIAGSFLINTGLILLWWDSRTNAQKPDLEKL